MFTIPSGINERNYGTHMIDRQTDHDSWTRAQTLNHIPNSPSTYISDHVLITLVSRVAWSRFVLATFLEISRGAQEWGKCRDLVELLLWRGKHWIFIIMEYISQKHFFSFKAQRNLQKKLCYPKGFFSSTFCGLGCKFTKVCKVKKHVILSTSEKHV